MTPLEHVGVAARPAATLALLRDGEHGEMTVLLVRRHIQSDFNPNVFVFPGGSVAPSDREAETTPGLCVAPTPRSGDPTVLGSGFRVAALRECFEEAGVLLARRGSDFLARSPDDVDVVRADRAAVAAGTLGLRALAERDGLTLETGDDLIHWAHWITPEGLPKRFDTHFFLTIAPEGQEAAHDAVETTESLWITPREALERFHEGALPLVLPTVHQLSALSGLTSLADARQRFGQATPLTVLPRIVGKEIVLPWDEQDGAPEGGANVASPDAPRKG